MHAAAQSAVWVKEPSSDAGVIIVTSAALPKYMIDKLHLAIEHWDEVGYLVVTQSNTLMLDWLQGSGQTFETSASPSYASHLLRGVSKGSYLLDVEVGPEPSLSWLGSVRGHSLRVVKLRETMGSNNAMDNQVEGVLSMVRALVKNVLLERCVL
ncbi:transketolase [Pseudomonas sp. PSKL.D1]|uniref:transketolase n=1 Tax=Pseudomonas sp. PSKL.D1 TaxID=3029060 RepID=UPI0023810BB2|nr:transketolase [Pseudomonas sp. PSKL.D1]WDY56924.1 transketolase [Pseudomonas sp. PSKL.D1]